MCRHRRLLSNSWLVTARQAEVGVLTREEADSCISVEFNPVRAGFAGGRDVWTRDVLNLGVSPSGVISLVLCFSG
jgi:hypothetical protein